MTYKYLLLRTLKIKKFLTSAEFCPHILLSFLLIFKQREQTPQCCLWVFFSFWIFLSHPYISLVQLLSCATSFQMLNQALKKATYFFHISHFPYEMVKVAKLARNRFVKWKRRNSDGLCHSCWSMIEQETDCEGHQKLMALMTIFKLETDYPYQGLACVVGGFVCERAYEWRGRKGNSLLHSRF